MPVERTLLGFGWSLALLGLGLFFLFGAYLGGITWPVIAGLGVNGIGYYLAATAGSALIGWGAILILTARADEARSAVAVGTGTGFLALSLMRF